jgi:hypothetical protein
MDKQIHILIFFRFPHLPNMALYGPIALKLVPEVRHLASRAVTSLSRCNAPQTAAITSLMDDDVIDRHGHFDIRSNVMEFEDIPGPKALPLIGGLYHYLPGGEGYGIVIERSSELYQKQGPWRSSHIKVSRYGVIKPVLKLDIF